MEVLCSGVSIVSNGGGIFSFCGFATSYVPLRFVDIKDITNLQGDRFIDPRQTLGEIFVHRGFAHAEGFCRLTYRSPGFQNIAGDVQYPFLNIVLHGKTPVNQSLFQYMASLTIYAAIKKTDRQMSVGQTDGNPLFGKIIER